MSRQMGGHCCCVFNDERQNVEDENQNGRPTRSTYENNIARVEGASAQVMMHFNDVETSKVTSEEKIRTKQNPWTLQCVLQFLATQSTEFCQSIFFKRLARDNK
ncbi:hypothetical protein TNCV_4765111 [Trichonephila clavipes]|nr:hypothetical protein TNCV_4765111 [Trichonephila clavipes]